MSTIRRPRGTGCMRLRGKIWWIIYSHSGRRIEESSHSEDQAVAKKLLSKRLGEIATGRPARLNPEKTTIRQLSDLVVEDYKHGKRRRVTDVEYRIGLHIASATGDIRASQ